MLQRFVCDLITLTTLCVDALNNKYKFATSILFLALLASQDYYITETIEKMY
jgi:hypothetical protein